MEKHSLQSFENYVEQRFGLGKKFALATSPAADGRRKVIEGFPLLRLDWRFYYADRVTFFFEYPNNSNQAEGFFVRLIYIPWLVP